MVMEFTFALEFTFSSQLLKEEDASGTDRGRCGGVVCLSLQSTIGGYREGESGRNEFPQAIVNA